MAEKLIVKNFAGIEYLEIEVKPINIIIGQQASGKSVCAKLLYYFKDFARLILTAAIETDETSFSINRIYTDKFKEYFPPNSWGNNLFIVRYEIADVFIEVTRKHPDSKEALIEYSDFLRETFFIFIKSMLENKKNEELSNLSDTFTNIKALDSKEQRALRMVLNGISMSLEKQAKFNQLFIPSGRSFFANLQANLFSFLSGSNTLDPFIREFGSIYEAVKDRERSILDIIESKDRNTVDLQKEVTRLVEQSLCGKHIRSRGRDFLESSDGRRIAVANSSSGQQELLPLIILLTALPNMLSANSGYTVYIEEPEAHLFPSSQRSIIELIATVFNYCQDNLQFFITTHSPYVLTSINNLLQAGIIYSDPDRNSAVLTQLEQIVPSYKALNTADVAAYVLENGKCTSIMCPETGLIDAKIIDSVSDDLAIEFDRMLDLT